jgi:hypothetical protein
LARLFIFFGTSYKLAPAGVASKLAKILGVSLDYLVGNTDLELDSDTMKRIQEVEKLTTEEKKMVYSFLDAFIDKSKIKTILL